MTSEPIYIENPYIYDGWSVMITPAGEVKNRWEKGTPRWKATETYINSTQFTQILAQVAKW